MTFLISFMLGKTRLRITINSTRKGERFLYFSTSIYLFSTYVPGTEFRGTKKKLTKTFVLMELTFQCGTGIKYIACYMVVSPQKKKSE